MSALVAPSALAKKGDQALVVTWNDGSRSEFDLRRLRIACPCAGCVNEWTGDKILDPRKIPENIKPNRMFSVGRYAMAIHWSDGHTTGIFSYDYLRRLSINPA